MMSLLALEPWQYVFDVHGDLEIQTTYFYARNKDDLYTILNGKPVKTIICIPSFIKAGYTPNDIFTLVCESVSIIGKNSNTHLPIIIAIDDMEYFMPSSTQMPLAFENIVRYARHWGIYYWVNTRRYTEIHKEIIASINHFYIGPSMDGNDQKRIEYHMGREALQSLSRSPEYTFLYKDNADKVCLVTA